MNLVITGASRGLGRAMAEKFARQGYDLYVTSRNDMLLYQTLQEWQQAFPGQTVKAKAFDLSSREGVAAFGGWIGEAGISVDVLINNAGDFLAGNITDEKQGVLEKMIKTNLYSAYHLTRQLVPQMIAAKKGHIFNICSIAGLQAYPGGGSYSISKFALAGFSKNLREELKPHGIKVTTVFPGAAYTDSWAATGISRSKFMEANDIAEMVWAAAALSPTACVEEIIMRPQPGDI